MLDNQWQPRAVSMSSSKSRELRLPVAPGTEPGVALAATEGQANGGINMDSIMYLGLALASIVLVWTFATTAAKE